MIEQDDIYLLKDGDIFGGGVVGEFVVQGAKIIHKLVLEYHSLSGLSGIDRKVFVLFKHN